MRNRDINKHKKRKKLGPTKRRRRKERIQLLLFLLVQLICISMLLVHTIKKYATDTMQCTHSFSTTITNVEHVTHSRFNYIVFDTCEGKVFFGIETWFSLNRAKIADKTLKEFEYLEDKGVEVNIRIRNEPDHNPLSEHFKEYEMAALEDDQAQIDDFERGNKISLVSICVLLSFWLIVAVGCYVLSII